MGSVSFVLWMEGAMLSQYVEKLVHIVTLSLSLMLSSSLSQARISSSPSMSHISSLRNISLYPPCAYDEDCVSDHKCMQYMCYPWKTSTGFRWCSKDDDCEKCCNNPSGHPVLRPTRNLSQQQLKKLDKGIGALAPLFMDSVICEGLDYSMMTQLESCQLYTTTTTTTDRTNKLHHTSGATPGVRNVKLYPGVGLFTLIFSYVVHFALLNRKNNQLKQICKVEQFELLLSFEF